MANFYADYLNRLEELHTELAKSLQGLPQEALDWKPGKEMNSIAVLITHLTGAERYWIGDVVAGIITPRDRAAEFRVSGIPLETLQKRIADSTAFARQVLNSMALPVLEEERVSPRDGQKFSVSWSLLHVLDHTAIHLGHIQLTRQLWEQSRH
jgi:uncharacterized damage-inducible protein DinB